MLAKIHSLQMTLDGKQLLTLELQGDFAEKVDEWRNKTLEMVLKPFTQKRTLNANAYAWVLINKLAEHINIPPVEIYKNTIRNIGGVSEVVCCQEKAVERFCKTWQSHGIGWQAEIVDSKIDGCSNVICYYGSSEYDKSQMARLIDLIVAECKAVGVETMPPAELARLCEAWNG